MRSTSGAASKAQTGPSIPTREICVNNLHPDTPITGNQARELAAALLEVADKLDE